MFILEANAKFTLTTLLKTLRLQLQHEFCFISSKITAKFWHLETLSLKNALNDLNQTPNFGTLAP